ncbi:MAG: creatininase family protein [Bacteroidota bacterium]|nr:creatininase family protein [Bacteroidota bacterium]
MNFSSLNWLDIEKYLEHDDRCILPIGCTEQHAFLSLSTDSILAEKISLDAAEPLNIPVLPVLNYGHTPLFMDYPGTISLKIETLWSVVKDILDSLTQHRFKKILIVNGHGGNIPLTAFIDNWKLNNPGIRIKFHNWWNSPKTIAKVSEIDPVASHASWMENFEWTRLKDIRYPDYQKPMVDHADLKNLSPEEVRKLLGDGNYGGFYQRSDDEMNKIWETAIKETRELLNDWN